MSAHSTPTNPTDGVHPQFDAKSYWETRLRNHPGLLGVGNTRLGRQYIQWLYKVRRANFLRLVPYLATDRGTTRVLDIGSGTGFYLRLWTEAGVGSVVGSDFTEIAVSRLRSEFPSNNIVQLDIGDVLEAVSPEQYDVVSAFDVLFHVVDEKRYQQAIRNVHTLLRPGGHCVFSDLLVHDEVAAGEHVAFRRLSHVVNLLNYVGFDVVCRVPMFVVMEEPIDTASSAYRFFWKVLTYPARKSDVAGFVIGGMLYPLELLLTRVMWESSTTEIVVCRKRSRDSSTDLPQEQDGHVSRRSTH